MITATQSEGYKGKKWSGGLGIKTGEEQEPTQMHSRVIWGTFGDCLGHEYLINPVSYPTTSCANAWTDEFSPKAS